MVLPLVLAMAVGLVCCFPAKSGELFKSLWAKRMLAMQWTDQVRELIIWILRQLSIRLQGLRTNGNGDRARPPTLQLQQLQDQFDAAMAKKRESDAWTSNEAHWLACKRAASSLEKLIEHIHEHGDEDGTTEPNIHQVQTMVNLRIEVAAACGMMGRHRQAAQEYELASTFGVRKTELFRHMGDALLQAGDMDKAKKAYADGIASSKGFDTDETMCFRGLDTLDSVEADTDSGKAALERGRYNDAIISADGVLRRSPNHEVAQGIVLDALLGKHQLEDARRRGEQWAHRLEQCNWQSGSTVLDKLPNGGGPQCIPYMHNSLREGYRRALGECIPRRDAASSAQCESQKSSWTPASGAPSFSGGTSDDDVHVSRPTLDHQPRPVLLLQLQQLRDQFNADMERKRARAHGTNRETQGLACKAAATSLDKVIRHICQHGDEDGSMEPNFAQIQTVINLRMEGAAAFSAIGRYRQAAEEYGLASALGVRKTELLRRKGESLLKAGDLDKANQAYMDGITSSQGLLDVEVTTCSDGVDIVDAVIADTASGKDALGRMKYGDAMTSAERALRRSPNHEAAQRIVLDVLLDENQPEEARRRCEAWAHRLEQCNWQSGATMLDEFPNGGGTPGYCIQHMHDSLREGYCRSLRVLEFREKYNEALDMAVSLRVPWAMKLRRGLFNNEGQNEAMLAHLQTENATLKERLQDQADLLATVMEGHALEVHLLNEERQNLVMENRCLESAKRGLERELSAAGPV